MSCKHSQATVSSVKVCLYLCSERQQNIQTVDPVPGDEWKVHLDQFEGVWLRDPQRIFQGVTKIRQLAAE